jgi:membrane protease subunit (stomatin/prohibitin family)
MGDKVIEFVKNYDDQCTENGFQFEFFCDRCGSGFRTRFKTWKLGAISNVAESVGDIFGGFLGRATDVGDKVKSAAWEKAHDSAYEEAVTEIKPKFSQCPRCSKWVCKTSCWNNKKGLCKECAPDLGVEMAAAQSSRSVEEIWAHASMSEEDKKLATENWRENIRATCPECNKPLELNAKFCPECGAKLKDYLFCSKCGEKITANSKFCPNCGNKVGE